MSPETREFLTAASAQVGSVSVLRLAKVPLDELAIVLGHAAESKITAGYGQLDFYDPEFLRASAIALERWFWKIRKIAKRIANSQDTLNVIAIPQGGSRQSLENIEKIGAGERIRTVDPNLGKVMLYP